MRTRHKQLTAVVIALVALAVGVTVAIGSASGESPERAGGELTQPKATGPWASYQQPTGPTLSDDTIRTAALKEAEGAGDPTPSSITVVNASFAEAVQAVDTKMTLSTPSSGGEASFEQSGVVLATLHGQFTLSNASVPQGRLTPSGTVLFLVFDAHTGRLDFRALEQSEPAGVSALGTPRALG